MGNSPSTQSQRPGAVTGAYQYPPPQQQQQQAYPPARVYAPPQGYQGYSNGQYYGNYGGYGPPPGAWGGQQPPHVPGQFGQPPHPGGPPGVPPRQPNAAHVQPQEFQATQTIRNQVNLKKNSIKVRPLPDAAGQLSVTFGFDATAACRATVFVNAKDDVKRNRVATPDAALGVLKYDKGIDQKYPGEGAAPVVVAASLVRDWARMPDDRFGVVVRLEALTDEGRAEGHSLDSVEPGAELPSWVQAQTTYARMHRGDDGTWSASHVTQKLWVKGNVFELQEIYGMEAGRPVDGVVVEGVDEVEGNECVICMSEPRDTTALPCRHMCMCHGCANELKTQTNKCPICRNVISSLLHIKIAAAAPPGAAAPARSSGSILASASAAAK